MGHVLALRLVHKNQRFGEGQEKTSTSEHGTLAVCRELICTVVTAVRKKSMQRKPSMKRKDNRPNKVIWKCWRMTACFLSRLQHITDRWLNHSCAEPFRPIKYL